MAPSLPHRVVNEGTSRAADGPSPARDTKLRLHIDDLKHPAARLFLGVMDNGSVLEDAISNVLKHLYHAHGTPRPVRSVTLILEPMEGVAYTTGLALDDLHKEIHVSLEYLAHRLSDPLAFQKEATGVIVHEMVHCWQHDGRGTAPGGLIEGIADYVRLKSGLAPPHWHRSRDQCGQTWDEGYQKTAWFLEWVEDRHGHGLVSRANSQLDGKPYHEHAFWTDLCGQTVDDLWKEYLAHWDHDKPDPPKPDSPKPPPASETGTEPELIDMDEREKAEAAKQGKQGTTQGKPFNA